MFIPTVALWLLKIEQFRPLHIYTSYLLNQWCCLVLQAVIIQGMFTSAVQESGDTYHDTGVTIQYIVIYCDTVSKAVLVSADDVTLEFKSQVAEDKQEETQHEIVHR